MSRTLSASALAELMAPESGDPVLFLLRIDEASLAETIRFALNTEDVVSNGETYVASFFSLELPTERGDAIDKARITVDNVDRQIVQAIRLAVGRPQVSVDIVWASDPDTVEAGPMDFELESAEYDALTVTGVLAYDDIIETRAPLHPYTPANYPDLF